MTDNKFPSPTGHPIASREHDTQVIVRGDDGQMRPLDDRLQAQIYYSIDLQRIIESICHGMDIAEPKTTARHHYDMAVKYKNALQTPASDTPPQSPNRAVLDVLERAEKALLSGSSFESGINCMEVAMMCRGQIEAIAATQADEVKVIPELEEAIQWADGGMQAGHFRTLVNASREHLKRQKGR